MNKVIICGGRDFKSMTKLIEAIENSGFEIDEIVHGGAKGADNLAGEYAKSKKIPVKVFEADWKNTDHPDAKVKVNNWGQEYNCLAGFWRNQEMVEYGTHCIVLEGGNGTADMLQRATTEGLEIFVSEGEEVYVF